MHLKRWEKYALVGATAVLLGGVSLVLPAGASRGASVSLTAPDTEFASEVEELGYQHALDHLVARNETRIINASPAAAAPRPAVAGDPSTVGQWTAPFDPGTPSIGIHAAMLRTGKVLMFGTRFGTKGFYSGAYVWDPITGAIHQTNPPNMIFCGGQTILADGKVYVAGGTLGGTGPKGALTNMLFDPVTETWTTAQANPTGYWYPTVTELQDGTGLIQSGTDSSGVLNPNVVRFNPNGTPQVSTVAVNAFDDYYAMVQILPDGNLLVEQSGKVQLLNPTTWTYSDAGAYLQKYKTAIGAGSVLLPGPPSGSNKVAVFGGFGVNPNLVTDKVQQYDATNKTAPFSFLAPIPEPRVHMNGVLLPDGTILGVGGNSYSKTLRPDLDAQLYNPATNTWTQMASQTLNRTYHSTAVLLPDGRVLSAGDNNPGGGGNMLEVYSPPYLFKGTRPATPRVASTTLSYGHTFTITTDGTATRAVLMAPSAVTHALDMHQRHVELAITATAGGLTATAPANANLAQPGWFMLFVLNSANVPSVATWVYLS